MAGKTIYYRDPLTDDFAKSALPPKPVPADFPFAVTNPLFRVPEFLAYRLIATPTVWLIGKIGYGLRIRNRRSLRKLRGTGYYLYGNHTQGMMDAYTPSLVAFPKHAHVVVSPQTVASPFLRVPVQLLGGIPVPGTFRGVKAFSEALSLRIREKRAVTIYPEAHIWPWYTGIRPFPNGSFAYPVKDGVPAVAFVTTYRRRKLFPGLPPRLTVTLSEPFYPDLSLGESAAKQKLRDQVYDFMRREAGRPDNFAYYEYVREEQEEKEAQTQP
ncbi:MAG: 1-acyl-sn-glycerol-3-phosphate acyltransferase [Clostridia bacterium]|nr:1-acyl-sn-glycerol-3-phosphate acyltransferase [Clostridia bacterium]